MNEDIRQLEPQIFWKHFADICNIPHPSGHEQQLAGHIKSFAQLHGLECKQDESGNLLLRKAPSPGCEHKAGVVLQAHLDMVPQKGVDKKFDFLLDSIETVIDGDWVKANDTTLGADDGAGVAAIMAVMESELDNCPEIYGLLTVEEETGLTGATALAEDFLPGNLLINLDAGSTKSIYVGCAGGISNNFKFENIFERAAENCMALKICLSGLCGGHSGSDIHLNRANSLKVISALLAAAADKFKLQLAALSGGSVANAIPRDAECVALIPQDQADSFNAFLTRETDNIKTVYSKTDPGMAWHFETLPSAPETCFKRNLQEKIIEFIRVFPNGAISMNQQFTGTVQTSANLAIAKTSETDFELESSHRSCSASELQNVQDELKAIARQYTANHTELSSYPGWEPVPDSPLVEKTKKIFKEVSGSEAKEVLVHAGLECGILSKKKPQMQMVAICADMDGYHSPYERLSISSTQTFWKILLRLLQNID